MRLALVAYLHGAGGAERQIILLANEMVVRGHDVSLIALADNRVSYHIAKEVRFIDISGEEHLPGFHLVNRYKSLKETLKRIRPEITINYNLQGAYLSLLIGRRYCGKVLYSERGDPYDKEYSGLLGLVRDITCRHLDAFVFQSEGARDFFKLKRNQKFIIIHNSVSVPLEKYPIPETRDNRIVTVGRLHPQKNPWLLLDAFNALAPRYPYLLLEFYGDGDLKPQLQKRIEELGLADRIKMLPSCSDIFERIRNARVFVLSSDYEGMPNALMEAMALGMPCVASDCRPGGARTLIKNGENGLLVPLRDPGAMSKAIAFMLDNPEKARLMGIEARHVGETHTNSVVFNMWNDFLLSL